MWIRKCKQSLHRDRGSTEWVKFQFWVKYPFKRCPEASHQYSTLLQSMLSHVWVQFTHKTYASGEKKRKTIYFIKNGPFYIKWITRVWGKSIFSSFLMDLVLFLSSGPQVHSSTPWCGIYLAPKLPAQPKISTSQCSKREPERKSMT